MEAFGTALTSILMAVIGVAIIAVIFGQNAQTANVLKAGGSAFSGILGTALSPVTGGGVGSVVNNILG